MPAFLKAHFGQTSHALQQYCWINETAFKQRALHVQAHHGGEVVPVLPRKLS